MTPDNLQDLENRLWANTGLKPSEFSNPVLGLIFLRYAEKRFHEAEARLIAEGHKAGEIEKFDYQAEGALYRPDNARFTYLLDLAEGKDLGKAINEPMPAVEAENEELKGGLSGDIRESNTYYEDPHKARGRFDFVMANPPFNVSGVDKERVKDDPRFPFGIPTTDNANYLLIQLFHSALNNKGRAGFVMANSAGEKRARTYAHIYENYFGAGRSIYQQQPVAQA
jgi:type I restriction-modification system DNA methylase subunit